MSILGIRFPHIPWNFLPNRPEDTENYNRLHNNSWQSLQCPPVSMNVFRPAEKIFYNIELHRIISGPLK